MSVEIPSKIIKFPKKKKIDPTIDREILKEVIKENMYDDLAEREEEDYREFKKAIPKLPLDFEVVEGGKK